MLKRIFPISNIIQQAKARGLWAGRAWVGLWNAAGNPKQRSGEAPYLEVGRSTATTISFRLPSCSMIQTCISGGRIWDKNFPPFVMSDFHIFCFESSVKKWLKTQYCVPNSIEFLPFFDRNQSNRNVHCYIKDFPLQTWEDPQDSRRLSPPNFFTIGTWRW